MKKEENFNKISFHDCSIENVVSKGKDLILYFLIDTHWFQGKPKGIMTLKNCKNPELYIKRWFEEDHNLVYISWLKISTKNKKIIINIKFQKNKNKFYKFESNILKFKRVGKYKINKKDWENTIKIYDNKR